MTWQEAILESTERQLSRAEFKLWEFKRNGRKDDAWEAEINAEISNAKNAYDNLLTRVVNATGPLNLFGGTDMWMELWDGQSNWLECLILNTPPADAVDLLIHLGIMPMKEFKAYGDGIYSVAAKKPISLTYFDSSDRKIKPISSETFLGIIKRSFERDIFSLGRMN